MSEILDAFTTSQPERTIADVAAVTGLPTSTVHRIMSTLATVGLLERPLRGRYRLGIRVHELGQTAVFGIDLRDQGFWRTSLDVFRADIDRYEELASGLAP